jgi:GT2 family glycosyltransferase/glycosyltransferase involved in cell wall biosynthesis
MRREAVASTKLIGYLSLAVPMLSESLSSDDMAALIHLLSLVFDPAFYVARYPDVVKAGLVPLDHYIKWGIGENRDPNPWFDSAWYSRRYPDSTMTGHFPLFHYLNVGMAKGYDPHPSFDTEWYVAQHPMTAGRALLYHLRVGRHQGWTTKKSLEIEDYLPVSVPPPSIELNQVAVVIPVYRGLQQTRRCLESVLSDIDRPDGQIIVIDDCSPDPELSQWLDSLANARRIVLERNKRNLGFVASVNRGMTLAQRQDVVLLNSDTEVPSGWLRRLGAHACREARVATISPFSNNATICGYPSTSSGPLALGASLSDLDIACRTANAGRHVDIPTSVGFCMFIARAALDDVGNFDATTFGLGYGEENDFCMRATARGWRHLLACDTFVYHEGAVSFGEDSVVMASRAMDVLAARYPDYPRIIERHILLDAAAPYRFAVTAQLFRQCGLPNILMISHALGGGVQRHIDEFVERLCGRANILLLTGSPYGGVLSVPALTGHPTLEFADDRTFELAAWLRAAGVSRVHIHHLAGLMLDVRSLIQDLGVAFDVTIHDYYAICPQINFLPWPDSSYCGEPGPDVCNSCIANRPDSGARDILSWRHGLNWLFQDAARVICPSHDVRERLVRYNLERNAIVVPHEPARTKPWFIRAHTLKRARLRVALLGTLANHKGAQTVASVAETDRAKSLDLRVIGDIEDDFPLEARKFIKMTGAYDDTNLPNLIANERPDVLWFPSPWPETYSYTLSAAIASGLPIVATDIGAFPERLKGRPLTWLVPRNASIGEWRKVFLEVRTVVSRRSRILPIPLQPGADDFYRDSYLVPRITRSKRTAPRKRVLMVGEYSLGDQLSPCAYVRLLQPLSHPAIAADFDVQIVSANSALRERSDIVVTQRHAVADLDTAKMLVAHVQHMGATLLYDLDDDLLHVPRMHPDGQALRSKVQLVTYMVAHADAVWVSTKELADRLPATKRPPVVVPNGLDERLWDTTCSPRVTHGGPVRILYMGTATHDADFAIIAPALARLKATFKDRVVIDVIGVTGSPINTSGITRPSVPNQATLSYPGFVNWITCQPPWDLGLAPLQDNDFTRCKSAIKTLDYAALGLATLASDHPVYRQSLANGDGGALVENSESAWYLALSRLVRDPERCRELGKRAHATFRRDGTLASQANTRRAAWYSLIGRHSLMR